MWHSWTLPTFLALLFTPHISAQANLPKLTGSVIELTSADSTMAEKSAPNTAANSPSVTLAPSLISLPALTITTSSSNYGGITNAPKIGAQPVTPIVPPTADAPFMQKSTLPEGTVFICVGAALGFFGIAVLAWRGLVAWSLHRSVHRAAIAHSRNYDQGRHRKKKVRRSSVVPFYSHGAGSNLSLDQLGASGRGGSGKKGHTPTGSLFFSPTAGAGMHTSSNRNSGYLPAGYYAAGNSAPRGGTGMTHIVGGAPLANLGHQKQEYSRARSMGPSPPESPCMPPSRGTDIPFGKTSTAGISTQASNSSLDLNALSQGRAPSAYLEDLFENHPPGYIAEKKVQTGGIDYIIGTRRL